MSTLIHPVYTHVYTHTHTHTVTMEMLTRHTLSYHGDADQTHRLSYHGDADQTHRLSYHGDADQTHRLSYHGDADQTHRLSYHGDADRAHAAHWTHKWHHRHVGGKVDSGQPQGGGPSLPASCWTALTTGLNSWSSSANRTSHQSLHSFTPITLL